MIGYGERERWPEEESECDGEFELGFALFFTLLAYYSVRKEENNAPEEESLCQPLASSLTSIGPGSCVAEAIAAS